MIGQLPRKECIQARYCKWVTITDCELFPDWAKGAWLCVERFKSYDAKGKVGPKKNNPNKDSGNLFNRKDG